MTGGGGGGSESDRVSWQAINRVSSRLWILLIWLSRYAFLKQLKILDFYCLLAHRLAVLQMQTFPNILKSCCWTAIQTLILYNHALRLKLITGRFIVDFNDSRPPLSNTLSHTARTNGEGQYKQNNEIVLSAVSKCISQPKSTFGIRGTSP